MTEVVVGLLSPLVLAAGLLLSLTCARPSATARRGANAWVGVRIPRTMTSKAAWTAGHRPAWPAARIGCSVGVALLFLASVDAGLGQTGPARGITVAVALVALVLLLAGPRSADRTVKGQQNPCR